MMINCEQFQEWIDPYVDGALSTEDTRAADAHRRSCASCSRAVAQRLDVRQSLRRLADAVAVPSELEPRVVRAVTPLWRRVPAPRVAAGVVAAVAFAFVVVVVVAMGGGRAVNAKAANTLDRLAVGVDDSSAVVITGTLLCRDCELSHRYGIASSCQRIGHHGAIFTADGVILNLVEQRLSSRLIHDESLFGKRILVRGRLLRGARALSVDSFEVES